MKWFNVGEIVKEIKKIRWPSVNEFFKTLLEVCVFVILFAIFFYAADAISVTINRLLGI